MHSPGHEIDVEPACGSEFDDTAFFVLNWRSAPRNSHGLPRFEDVALGSLGRLSDETALLTSDGRGDFQVLRAGIAIEQWIGRPLRGTRISELSPDYAVPLGECFARAAKRRAPSFSLAHFVRDGLVSCVEIHALPLATRSSDALVLAFARERAAKYSLVEALFQASNAGLVTLASMRHVGDDALDFQIVGLNPAVLRMFDQSSGELLWRQLSEALPALVSDGCMVRLAEVLSTGRTDEFETAYARADGSVLQLQVTAAPIGELLSVTASDVTDLKAREASFRLLFEKNPLPMILYHRGTFDIVNVNDAALAHYGYSKKRFLAMRLRDLHPEEERSALEANRAFAAQGHAKDHSWRHIVANGDVIDVQIFAREQSAHGEGAVLAAIVDVTEQRAMQRRIAHIANHDPLTDLANRVLLHERINTELARVKRQSSGLALLWLDLDQFKQVNDALGHPVGDQLLRLVADRLRQSLRMEDVAARIGGDEFAVLLVEAAGLEQANSYADRLIERLSEPYEVDGRAVICGCSIGIALAPNDSMDADELLKKADIALYRAKAEGRGVHRFFQPGMDEQLERRRAMAADLRSAIAEQSLSLVYQPIVDLRSRRIVSFEALLRWSHPTRGAISPVEFIPLAEETGLITPLGDWVLKNACAEAAKWPESISIAVNLSSVQVRSPTIVQSVITALAQSGLSSHRLELEVTESVLLNESTANLETLHALRNIGLKISMDDFGTGYSSLSYLRAFPFDKIKLDRSFVKDLPDSAESLAIVRAMSGLGRSLGLTILAEGIETDAQMLMISDEGFNEGQGFLFSRPQPAENIPDLIQKASRRTHSVA